MADVYCSGIGGYVKLGAASLAMGTYTGEMQTNFVPVNNFTSVYQLGVSGITKMSGTASGPFNSTNNGMTCGSSYVLHLGISCTALIKAIRVEGDVDGRISLSFDFESNGAFTATVV